MENGEIYSRQPQPEIPSQPTQTPEDQKRETEKPQQATTELLDRISDQVKTEKEQTPVGEIDHRAQKPDAEIVGSTADQKTKPLPEISIPEVTKIFQDQSRENEGTAAQNAVNTTNELRKAA